MNSVLTSVIQRPRSSLTSRPRLSLSSARLPRREVGKATRVRVQGARASFYCVPSTSSEADARGLYLRRYGQPATTCLRDSEFWRLGPIPPELVDLTAQELFLQQEINTDDPLLD